MQVESNAVRCPDADAAQRMYDGERSTAAPLSCSNGGAALHMALCVHQPCEMPEAYLLVCLPAACAKSTAVHGLSC